MPRPVSSSPLSLPRALRVAGSMTLALGLVVGALAFGDSDPLPGPVLDPISAPDSESRPDAGPRSRDGADATREERALVQAHLAQVEAALRAVPTGHLDADQRANRATLLDELLAYRLAGAFPRNAEVAGRSPVFVDDDGVHCAVGHLLHRTGEDELVAAVAKSRNHARIFDLLDEPALVAWLEASGLSAVEAAWIQPAYCNLEGSRVLGLTWCPPWPNPGPEELSREYLGLTVGTSTLGAALAGVNLLDLRAGHPSAGRGLLGMGVGAAGVGLGAAGILDGGGARRAGWVNVAFGVLGVGTGAWTFHRARIHEVEGEATRPAVASSAVSGPTFSIQPWVPVGPGGVDPEAIGLSVRIAR